MATAVGTDEAQGAAPLEEYAGKLAAEAKAASRVLATLSSTKRDAALALVARRLRENPAAILEANARDIEAAPGFGLNAAATDRLRLNEKRLGEMAQAAGQSHELLKQTLAIKSELTALRERMDSFDARLTRRTPAPAEGTPPRTEDKW